MMKDKLEKTGHRKPYHTMRRLGLWAFSLLCLAGVSSIPVGISYRMAEEAAAAQISEYVDTVVEETSTSAVYA